MIERVNNKSRIPFENAATATLSRRQYIRGRRGESDRIKA